MKQSHDLVSIFPPVPVPPVQAARLPDPQQRQGLPRLQQQLRAQRLPLVLVREALPGDQHWRQEHVLPPRAGGEARYHMSHCVSSKLKNSNTRRWKDKTDQKHSYYFFFLIFIKHKYRVDIPWIIYHHMYFLTGLQDFPLKDTVNTANALEQLREVAPAALLGNQKITFCYHPPSPQCLQFIILLLYRLSPS